jgi:hypothetical protein
MPSPAVIEISPEQRALLLCARVDLDPPGREQLGALLRSGLDLAVLARIAQHHGLTPLLCRHLHAVAPDACPPDVLQGLRTATAHSVVASLALAAELVELLAALRAAGVPALAIKGPVSAALCYGDYGLRAFSDLDLLIEPGHVRVASELLAARGYAPRWPLSAAWAARLLRTGSEQLFSPAEGRRLVDLHWCLMPRGYSFTPDGTGVFARRHCVRVGTAQVPTLGIEPTLLFLLLHGMKHDWESLGWLCDVAELVRRRRNLDWDAVLAWSAPPGRRRFVDIGLALAHQLLGAPVPATVLQRGQSDPAVARTVAGLRRRLFAERPAGTLSLTERSVGLWYFRAMQRTRDRLHFVHDVVFRPTPLEWRAVPLPPQLALLHYLVRPVRLIWKHTRPGRAAS